MAHYADAPRPAKIPLVAPQAATGARAPGRLIWSLIAAIAVIVVFAPLAGFTIAWHSYAMPGGAVAAMLLVTWFYRARRCEERIAAAVEGTAQLAAFAAVGAPLSYLAARCALPLQDHLFDTIDKALGLDWTALLAWMNAHRGIHAILSVAYMSFAPQATITVCVLAFTGRVTRLRVFVLAFILTALATIAVSAVLPAQGVWLHYGLHAEAAIVPVSATSWPVFLGIRDGSFLTLMAAGSEGIITFPSLHAALGLIFALALWPIRVLRWFGLALNLLMIVATPVDGSHYFVDVFAGLAIALMGWFAARRMAVAADRS
jgi:hypothetical protein